MSSQPNSARHGASSGADRAVSAINQVNAVVTHMVRQREDDPDTLSDHLLQYLVPAITGLIGGRLFQLVWDAVTSRNRQGLLDEDNQDKQQGLIMSMLFAGASAAFGTLLSTISTRGINSFIQKRHNRRAQ